MVLSMKCPTRLAEVCIEVMKTINPLSEFYIIMLMNENGAVRRGKFRMNTPKSYSGNIGENYKNHHFSFSGINLDFP